MRSAAAWSALPAISAWFRSIPTTLRFDGIVRRHLEIMTGAGIVAGLVYWMIAGRNAGAWREPPRPLRPPPPLPSHSPLAAGICRRHPERGASPARSQAFSSPTSSAKPRAMNRTGLFIALALALVVGLLFGIYPELDLKLAALFYDPATKSFPLKLNTLAAIARDGAMWIAWGLALPAIVALVVKLVRPDRPLLMSGRAIVFLLVTLTAFRRRSHQSHLQELLGPAAPGGGDAVQRRSSSSCRGGIRAAAAAATARSSPAKAPPRSGPMRPRR